MVKNEKNIKILRLFLNGLANASPVMTKLFDREDNSAKALRLTTNATDAQLYSEIINYLPKFDEAKNKAQVAGGKFVNKSATEYKAYVERCMQVVHNRICEAHGAKPAVVCFMDFNGPNDVTVDDDESLYDLVNTLVCINSSDFVNSSVCGEQLLVNLFYETYCHILAEKMIKIYKGELIDVSSSCEAELYAIVDLALSTYCENSPKAIDVIETKDLLQSNGLQGKLSREYARIAMLLDECDFTESVSPKSIYCYMNGLEECLTRIMATNLYNDKSGGKFEGIAYDFYEGLSKNNATDSVIFAVHNRELFEAVGIKEPIGQTLEVTQNGKTFWVSMDQMMGMLFDRIERGCASDYFATVGIKVDVGVSADEVNKALYNEFYSRHPELDENDKFDDEGFPIVDDEDYEEFIEEDFASPDDVDISELEKLEDEEEDYEDEEYLGLMEMPNIYNYAKNKRERITGVYCKKPNLEIKIGDNQRAGDDNDNNVENDEK